MYRTCIILVRMLPLSVSLLIKDQTAPRREALNVALKHPITQPMQMECELHRCIVIAQHRRLI